MTAGMIRLKQTTVCAHSVSARLLPWLPATC